MVEIKAVGSNSPMSAETVTEHWLTATDGLKLRLCEYGEGDRSLLLLPGRTEPAEKYVETVSRLLRHGWTVFVADWRGQGRSGGRPAHNPQIGHAKDFDLHVADLALYLRAVQATRPLAPVTILAHSMGGGIALRYLQITPHPPTALKRVIALGPMITLPDQGVPRPVIRLVAEIACLLGRSDHYALGQGDWGAKDRDFPENGRTSDPARFAREVILLTDTPALQVGGPSWGWVRAALRLSARLMQGFRSPVPVHLLQGEEDPYVPLSVLRQFHSRVANSTLGLLPGALHEPLMERDEVQAAVWAVLDPLLRQP